MEATDRSFEVRVVGVGLVEREHLRKVGALVTPQPEARRMKHFHLCAPSPSQLITIPQTLVRLS